jgi:hypothetical protein
MSAAFVLMITDGQDTQKRAEDLQVAGYAVVQAWRRRADRHRKQAINGTATCVSSGSRAVVIASSPFQGERGPASQPLAGVSIADGSSSPPDCLGRVRRVKATPLRGRSASWTRQPRLDGWQLSRRTDEEQGAGSAQARPLSVVPLACH